MQEERQKRGSRPPACATKWATRPWRPWCGSLVFVGQCFGDHVVKSKLGGGAEGIVYRTEHRVYGHTAAIKVLHPRFAFDQGAALRFAATARAVMQTHHPNVIRIGRVDRLQDGTIYYVMELLQGHTLPWFLERRPFLSPGELQPLVDQICNGLQASHDQGVLHLNLRPDKIFIQLNRRPAVKLLGFGAALSCDRPQGRAAAPAYFAPEQAMGRQRQVGQRSDLFSVGAILYAVLCGEPPFRFGDMGSLAALVPLKVRNPAVSEAVAKVVHACLEEDPDRRPFSAYTLARAFKDATEGKATVG